MNLEPVIQSEVSQREKQISYINVYIWNLEKWYWWTSLQGRNRDTESRQVYTAEVGLIKRGALKYMHYHMQTAS